MGLVFHLLYPRYSGPLTPTAPTASKLWETFTFLPHRSVFNSLPHTCQTRMVVHGQLVVPAVCLSDLSVRHRQRYKAKSLDHDI